MDYKRNEHGQRVSDSKHVLPCFRNKKIACDQLAAVSRSHEATAHDAITVDDKEDDVAFFAIGHLTRFSCQVVACRQRFQSKAGTLQLRILRSTPVRRTSSIGVLFQIPTFDRTIETFQ